VVIIEVARSTIRASLGLHDLLKTPFIVGLISATPNMTEAYIFRTFLRELEYVETRLHHS